MKLNLKRFIPLIEKHDSILLVGPKRVSNQLESLIGKNSGVLAWFFESGIWMYGGDNLLTPPKAFFNEQCEPVVLDETQAKQLTADWEDYLGFQQMLAWEQRIFINGLPRSESAK
jgi:hypothetical protein